MRYVGRRTFFSEVAATGLLAGAGPFDRLAELTLQADDLFIPGTQDSDEKVFAAARRELLFPTNITFCNTGTWGASPREVIDAVVNGHRAIERELPNWDYRPDPMDLPPPPTSGYRPLIRFREEVGAVISAPAEELAFTQNATMAMSFLANGIDLAKGDEILTTDQEHAGGLNSWLLRERRHGIVVKQVPLGPSLVKGPDAVLQLLSDAMTPRTRVVMFSHITSLLGIKLPAREICTLAHERGALAIVDGAQAIGQIPVDVKGLSCDAYVTSTHKWLLAPKGTGLLYVRREVQDRFWSTLATTGYDDRSTGAFRFMRFGTGSFPTVLGLIAAVRFMTRLGIERVERWDRMLTSRLRDGLAKIPHVRMASPSDPRFSAALTTFAVSGRTPDQVQDELWKGKIRVRAEGDVGVRVSAHFYNAPADIDRVLNIIGSMR